MSISAGVHETAGKIDSIAGVHRTPTPHPAFFALLSWPQFPVAITLSKVSHATGPSDRVHNSSGNYGLCVSRFFRSRCNQDIRESEINI